MQLRLHAGLASREDPLQGPARIGEATRARTFISDRKRARKDSPMTWRLPKPFCGPEPPRAKLRDEASVPSGIKLWCDWRGKTRENAVSIFFNDKWATLLRGDSATAFLHPVLVAHQASRPSHQAPRTRRPAGRVAVGMASGLETIPSAIIEQIIRQEVIFEWAAQPAAHVAPALARA